MARRFRGEENKTEESEFNPYNLFLILILLILSQDVLQMMLKAQKLREKKQTNTTKAGNKSARRILNILPVQEKANTENKNKEPKEEQKDND